MSQSQLPKRKGWDTSAIFTVRVRLTLWNMLILALVLGGFGATMCIAVQARQSAAIDRDLRQRAEGRGPGPRFRLLGGPEGHGRMRRMEEHRGGPGPDGGKAPQRWEENLGRPVPTVGKSSPSAGIGKGVSGGKVPASASSQERREGRRILFREGYFLAGPGEPPQVKGRARQDLGEEFHKGPDGGRSGEPPGPPPRDWMMPPWDREELTIRRQREFPEERARRLRFEAADGDHYFDRPLIFDLEGKPHPFFPEDKPWDPAALTLSAKGEERLSTVDVDGERVRVFSVPLRRDEKVVGAIQFAHPLGEQQRLADSQWATLVVLIPAALLVAGISGLFLTDRALRPVREVTEAAAEIGAADLSRRLKVSGRDELAVLALTFNGMIGRLEEAFHGLGEAYRKLEGSYEQQRRFTGDASHELRTPLTRIKGSTSLALAGPPSMENYREALETADEAADVMNRLIQDLLLLARSENGQLPLREDLVPVEGLLRKSVSNLSLPSPQVQVEKVDPELLVTGDPIHLNRVLVNLLENAVRHTPLTGDVRVSAVRAGEEVLITVADTGEGIPEEHLPHVCERFYRVDQARTGGAGGTGLGLAICQGIVRAHGGTLEIRSTLGRGTTVELRLPAVALPDEEEEETAAREERMPALVG